MNTSLSPRSRASRPKTLSLSGLALLLGCLLFGGAVSLQAQTEPPYKDSSLPVDTRVADLVSRMTQEEKARQLDMYFGCESLLSTNRLVNLTHARPDAVFDTAMAEKNLGHLGVGAIHDLFPRAKLYNEVQGWIMKSNRLGIPALFIEEGLHGYMDFDEVVFPQSINLATTWNPDLARRTGAAIAAQARANGVGMILGPVLDVARDPRWGRVEEDFGEDPYLTGQFGLAVVQGMQGESLNTDHTVIAEPKHFSGHGSPESGLNTAPVHAGEREVRTVMLKSFEPAIREGGARGIMAAYHDIDGVPCAGNPWLLTQVLRDEWGFRGFVLSDLGAIRRLYDTHHVAASPAAAVWLALNSGVDMQFYDFNHDVFQNAVLAGVQNEKVPTATLNRAVARVLRAKFELGLFDRPLVDEHLDATVRHSAAQTELALESARQSLCLLKNENRLLPLAKNLKHLAVIGPNAELPRLGDYSDAAREDAASGMLAQIRRLVSSETEVTFTAGTNLEAAVALARQAEVVILGLGERRSISGEGFDRSELGLPDNQEALLEAVAGTGKPVVLVLQNGRPLTLSWAAENIPAILEAWYPGEFGGQAIAETLFGDSNPAGRLPISFPRSVGQSPVYYNHFPSKKDGYVDGPSSPLFAFGHGLSYTTFTYDDLKITVPPQADEDIAVTAKITNTGTRAGDEVAQLYVRQTTASVATPIRALKGFSRIHLQPGETKPVSFALKRSELAVWNARREWQVEPGEYLVYVGGSSQADLSARFTLNPPAQ